MMDMVFALCHLEYFASLRQVKGSKERHLALSMTVTSLRFLTDTFGRRGFDIRAGNPTQAS